MKNFSKCLFSIKLKFVPLLCYGAAICVWFGMAMFVLCSDGLAVLTGEMPTWTVLDAAQAPIETDAVVLQELAQAEQGYVATSQDPCVYWYNHRNINVRTLTLTAQYDKRPGDIALYYQKNDAQAFSQDRMVYPIERAEGVYEFTLPYGEVHALRLDPCSDICVLTDFSITLNTPRAWYRYFIPTWVQAFCLALFPALVASGISIVSEMWLFLQTCYGKRKEANQ